MGMLESLRQGFGGVGNCDQMHVIRHQAVTEHRKAVKFRVLPHQLEISNAVGVRRQNDLPGVSPLGNMMRNINHHDASEAGHLQ